MTISSGPGGSSVGSILPRGLTFDPLQPRTVAFVAPDSWQPSGLGRPESQPLSQLTASSEESQSLPSADSLALSRRSSPEVVDQVFLAIDTAVNQQAVNGLLYNGD